MQHRQEEKKLFLKVEQNLNLVTAHHVARAAEDMDEVYLDLSDARIVDSEGIILLYRLIKAGKKVHLRKIPPILVELVEALELEDIIPLENLASDNFKV